MMYMMMQLLKRQVLHIFYKSLIPDGLDPYCERHLETHIWPADQNLPAL